MTVGNYTRDNRTTQVLYSKDCYGESFRACKVGSYVSRYHSGGDSPKGEGISYTTELVRYNIYDKQGRFVKIRTRKLRHYTKRPVRTENPYVMSLSERNDVIGRIVDKCYNNYNPVDTSGYPCLAASYPQWDGNENLALIGKLSDKLGAGFNLGVFLGEGRESLNTITGAATRIYRAAHELRKGRISNANKILFNGGKSSGGSRKKSRAKQASKDFASDWLQLQYGWLPLLNDVYSACKHLAYMQNRPFVMQYRVHRKVTWEGYRNLDSSTSFSGWSSESRSLIAKITSVNDAAILGLMNPAAIAWELVPYSFVFDWFIPVGAYLEAINLRSGLSGKFIMSSKNDFRTYSIKQKESSLAYAAEFKYYARSLGFERSISDVLPVSLPTLKPLSKVVSWQHAANAVALLTNFVRA